MSEPTDDRPHDVLAAEEFGVPAGDLALRHVPLRLPDEPYPAAEAHDVLAAEEFAMPAGRRDAGAAVQRGRDVGRLAAVGGAVLVGALGVRLRRRRRRLAR